MVGKNTKNYIYIVCEWIVNLVYLNFLWILFTLMGLGIFGFFPATVTMCACIKEWFKDNQSSVNFKMFWNVYKSQFFRSNILMVLSLLFGLFLLMGVDMSRLLDSSIEKFIDVFMYILFFLYLVTILNVFNVASTPKIKVVDVVKYSFLVGILYPLRTILIVTSLILLGMLFIKLPLLLPFFLASLVGLILIQFTHNTVY